MPYKMTNEERIQCAYQDIISASVALYGPVTLTDIRACLSYLQSATSVLRAAECSMSGIPEPKEG